MWFSVQDFDDALDRVRVAGGTVVAVTSYDSGPETLCEDNQGAAFKLIEPAPGYDR
jgi:predicted enzyme related to lactoylglutathione lyase